MKNNELMSEIEILMEKVPEERHSYFQLQYFVIGKQPTIQSKMWHCLNQLKSRKESIDTLEMQIDNLKDDIELIDIKIAQKTINKKDSLSERESLIWKRKQNRNKELCFKKLEKFKNDLKYCIQEARFFVEMYKKLEAIEPLKDFDDLEAQTEYWNVSLAQKINLKAILGQSPDMELIETILALPNDTLIKKQMVNTIEHLKEINAAAKNKQLEQKL